MAKLGREKMQKIADERARLLYQKNWGEEMAKYKAFGIPEEQREEFIQMVKDSFKKLIGD